VRRLGDWVWGALAGVVLFFLVALGVMARRRDVPAPPRPVPAPPDPADEEDTLDELLDNLKVADDELVEAASNPDADERNDDVVDLLNRRRR